MPISDSIAIASGTVSWSDSRNAILEPWNDCRHRDGPRSNACDRCRLMKSVVGASRRGSLPRGFQRPRKRLPRLGVKAVLPRIAILASELPPGRGRVVTATYGTSSPRVTSPRRIRTPWWRAMTSRCPVGCCAGSGRSRDCPWGGRSRFVDVGAANAFDPWVGIAPRPSRRCSRKRTCRLGSVWIGHSCTTGQTCSPFLLWRSPRRPWCLADANRSGHHDLGARRTTRRRSRRCGCAGWPRPSTAPPTARSSCRVFWRGRRRPYW